MLDEQAQPGQAIRIHPMDVPFDKVKICSTSSKGTSYNRWVPFGMPRLGKYQAILDVVFFLYKSVQDAEAGINSGGTGFLVSVPTTKWPDQYNHIYAVTNWHVAVRDGFSVIRINTLDGQVDTFDHGPHEWNWIPNFHDIAVIPLNIDDKKHKAKVLDSVFLKHEVGLDIDAGDDVFMAGRFIDYDGKQTNKPAFRFGHISMKGAPIVQANQYKGDSIVIDLHSRSGFSGSPVFVYRTIGSEFFEAQPNTFLTGGTHTMKLLGIHWGQFPESWELKQRRAEVAPEDAMIVDGAYVEGLSGMTCVCPAAAIWELLHIPALQKQRAAMEVVWEQSIGPSSATPAAE